MRAPRDDHTGHQPALLARLRRVPKRYVLLALLVPVLVVLWLPLITGKRRNAPPPPAPDAAPPSAPAGEIATAPPRLSPSVAAALLVERLERAVRPYEPRWSSTADPAPFRAPTIVDAETVADADAELVPSSIVLSAGRTPIAIIAGRTYAPGDTIAGRSILAIEERRVLFRDGNRTYAVSLPEPTLGGNHD